MSSTPGLSAAPTLDRTEPAREYVYTEEDQRFVDTLRVLAADAVEKVGSGHPGTAMALAPVAWQLFQNVMHLDPSDDRWLGRDRFILSPGHSSLTLYLQLFAAGFGVELDDLKSLRTWGSNTPGHPEYGHTPGVEITTGPLGQGLASAVGFAYEQRRVRGMLDPDAPAGTSPFDHHIFVIASDGDVQEGVTSEASSLAGAQELGNLVVIYDDNQISIEDDTNVAFSEDVAARYRAYGWDVHAVDWTEGGSYQEDPRELYDAVCAAKAETGRPSMIVLRTVIGWPSPTKQNTGGIHGAKLGTEELEGLKERLDFDPEKHFDVDEALLGRAREIMQRASAYRSEWEQELSAWRAANPDGSALLDRITRRELPGGFSESFPAFEAAYGEEAKGLATRAASGTVLNSLAEVMPELWGGSADLAGSNNTTMKGQPSFIPEARQTDSWSGSAYGRTLHFGIREHAAAAIVNGISLGAMTRAYAGTFLIFSDYQRPAVRLSALMQLPSIFVWTHDSIGLGEDGPTHQPVEQLASLRAIPGLDVVRPADANEVSWAWKTILQHNDRPAGLVLSRQALPVFPRGEEGFADAAGVAHGAYVLRDAVTADGATTTPDVVLIATGSEVQLAVTARDALQAEGIAARVVSAPCLEWFDAEDEAYRTQVLGPDGTPRVSVEAGVSQGWPKYTGSRAAHISLEHFGASANYERLFDEFGITADAVAEAARHLVQN